MAKLKPIVTQDFQRILSDEVPLPQDKLDMRNFIYARDATFTIKSYIGYLNTIKPIAMNSEVGDYMLRLGFIPLIMPPSFWEDKAHTMILPKLPKSLPYHPRPAVSFLATNFSFRSDYPDIWVSKLDAAELCGCKPELVTVRGVLEKCGL